VLLVHEWKALIEELTGAAKAIVPSKKKKDINEETRINCGLSVMTYEWVRPDESLTGSTRAFIHGIGVF
jgi:hypothetical protein